MSSRTERIKKNLIVNIIKYATQMVLQFVLRTALIYTMGAEYLGLNGLFTNIFAFLNLAELGIGSAIVFSMYKPIADNDIEKVKALQNLYKKFYFYIFLVVLAIGGVITPFVKVFIKNDVSVNINIYLLFIMYLVNTLVGYLSAHKRSLLFAYQRADIENTIKTICNVGMTIAQIVVLVVFKNYYIFFAVNILATLVECLLTHRIANKYFPYVNGKTQVPLDNDTKKEITKNVVALSMHKIGGAVVNSTDNILISSFIGVVVLGAYSNYLLITSALASIFNIFVQALQGSVGNLIASSDVEKVYSKYKQINIAFAFLSAFTAICFFVLVQPFIEIWTGGGEYLLELSTVLIITISMYISKMRQCTLLFRDTAGLFWKDRWKPIAESIINLVSSIVLVKLIGINGVFLGTIISSVFAPLWVEPYVLYKHYFKKSLWKYFAQYLIDVLITVVVGCVCYFICGLLPVGGIALLILKFGVCILLSGGLLVVCYSANSHFRSLLRTLKGMFLKFLHKKKKTD